MTRKHRADHIPLVHSTVVIMLESNLQNALTVDVEDYFQVAALASAVSRESWPSREYRVDRNTSELLELFDNKGVHATFFVLGWVAERSPSLIRRIADAGHDVASHGYSHRCVYEQTPEEFREETIRSKGILENLIGEAVTGYRAASFSITKASLWALDVLIDLGFQYDSSVFPIRHDRYGIPDAGRHAGILTAPSGRTLVEFPMSTATLLGQRLPVSGGGYFRLLPYRLIRTGLRQVNRSQQQPFVFYLHPWEIDPGQPRIDAGRLSTFRHYTNLGVCKARLGKLLDEFRFTTMRDVLQQHGFLKRRSPAFPS